MARIGKYEAVFVVNTNKDEEADRAVIEKVLKLIGENSSDAEVNEWGKRRLAYPIEDLTDGIYVQVNFSSDTEFPAELNRVCKITDGVIRYIVVALEA